MKGGWSVVMATGSPVALAARREGRGRDRQGPGDPRLGGYSAGLPEPGPNTAMLCHWHRHVCPMPRCGCQAVPAAHTRLAHVAGTF